MDVDSKNSVAQTVAPAEGARASAPAGTIPTQRSRAGGSGPHGGRSRRTWYVVAGSLALVLAGTTTGVAAQRAATLREEQVAEARLRISAVLPAATTDAGVRGALDAQAATAVYASARTAAATSAQQTVEHALATLVASPQAGDGPRGQLYTAAGAVSAAIAGPNVSIAALRAGTAGVPGLEKTVVDAQAAWVAAEQARIAAEQAAAAEAARQAAARASTKTTVKPRSTRTTTTQSSGGSAAPAPTGGVPAGGKVCQGSGGAAAEASASAVGQAINAYRASAGLGALSISRSGSLTSHALNMAATGGIWHSGGDNIVGCVSNGSASSLVSAWSRSPGHNAQMLRTDVSSMSVGAATSSGWLFGAVRFS